MGAKRRIVIAEDHTILREGLRALFSQRPGLEVVGEAKDGRDAIRCAERLEPDLLLLDLSMPGMNGLEALREIKGRCPKTKVLVLTVHDTEEHVLEALRSGANGYVLKDANQAELMMAVETVLVGKSYLSPGVSAKVIEGFLEGKKGLKPRSSWESLTPRERVILKLIGEGRKNKEIADYLCISVKTAEKHRSNLMRKLDLHSSAALISYAVQKGLVET